MLYFLSPVAVIALQRWPSLRLRMTLFGQAVTILALIAASFADSVTDLIFTQGALYGIGGAFLYNPFVFYLDEWFIERKGLAFGILWAGTGISGTIVPLIMEWGLERYGFRTMLRACAVVLVRYMWTPTSNTLVTDETAATFCHSVVVRCQTTTTHPSEGHCPSIAFRFLSKYYILGLPGRQCSRGFRLFYAICLLAM